MSVADRLATMGPKTKRRAVESHVEPAQTLMREALAWRAGERPRSPLDGDELMAALEMEPGPEVGHLLERIDEAAFAGEVVSRDQALALARRERS